MILPSELNLLRDTAIDTAARDAFASLIANRPVIVARVDPVEYQGGETGEPIVWVAPSNSLRRGSLIRAFIFGKYNNRMGAELDINQFPESAVPGSFVTSFVENPNTTGEPVAFSLSAWWRLSGDGNTTAANNPTRALSVDVMGGLMAQMGDIFPGVNTTSQTDIEPVAYGVTSDTSEIQITLGRPNRFSIQFILENLSVHTLTIYGGWMEAL